MKKSKKKGKYVGLKDKNGKKIRVGDIVKFGHSREIVKFPNIYRWQSGPGEYWAECGANFEIVDSLNKVKTLKK